MNKPLDKWLATQPKEFVDEFYKCKMLGDGSFTIAELRELDSKFNPEDENERRS